MHPVVFQLDAPASVLHFSWRSCRRLHPIRRGGVAAGALALTWSPDGSKLAFTDILGRGLWAMNADGSHLVRLVTAGAISATTLLGPLTWFPGKVAFIAFLRVGSKPSIIFPPPRRSSSEIYVMNADGTSVKRLTHNRVGEGSPAWQPASP